ncbi:MAG: hypothetical protein R3F19_31090 [Verrucomicrobiales bacterium]
MFASNSLLSGKGGARLALQRHWRDRAVLLTEHPVAPLAGAGTEHDAADRADLHFGLLVRILF